jgi:1-acyl-sn-glycerol-3-phosphate acyltransferase
VIPARFIAKSEIRAWPVAGWIAERAGTIFIRRERRRDTSRINALVHAALAEGEFIGLFPEGTTGDGDELLRFHSSLFEPAVANGALVYPAAIRYVADEGSACDAAAYGDRTFMQSLALIIGQRSFTATLRFGAPLATRGASRRDIALSARGSVATLLAAPAPHTAPGIRADPPGAAR